MKLWLLSQDDVGGYDTFDSCVVCAESEEVARTITPATDKFRIPVPKRYRQYYHGTWTNDPDKVIVQYLGEASPEVEEGVVLSSFNAG